MKLRYKILREGARPLQYARPGDAGMDLAWTPREDVAAYPLDLKPGETWVFKTGIAVEIPLGFEGQVRPRSGNSKRGVHVHLGTIDSGYRGEVGVTITNLSEAMQRFAPGDRIAQLVLSAVPYCQPEEAEELTETERGANGWGSSGV